MLSDSGDVTQYILDQGIGYFIISLYKWNNENSAITREGIWSGHSRYTRVLLYLAIFHSDSITLPVLSCYFKFIFSVGTNL